MAAMSLHHDRMLGLATISFVMAMLVFIMYLYNPKLSITESSFIAMESSWPNVTISRQLSSVSGAGYFNFSKEFYYEDSSVAEILPQHPDEVERHFPYPFVSGDMFRFISDYIFDENEYQWSPDQIRPCQTVFVKNDRLSDFFSDFFPRIRFPFILITHNGDDPAPGPFRDHLADPRLFAWFAQNLNGAPLDKLRPIPIGISNSQWETGNIAKWREAAGRDLPQWDERPNLLFISWSDGTNPIRSQLKDKFRQFTNDTIVTSSEHDQFVHSLAQSKFVLSPPGNGLDCHRHWEAILMGAVPIVLKSGIDPLFESAPAVIVDDFDFVKEDCLRSIRPSASYNRDVVWSNSWLRKIKGSIQECRDVNRIL